MTNSLAAPARRRRSFATVAAAALALVGLVSMPTSAQAAVPTATISPSTVAPGATQTFTVTVAGTNDQPLGQVSIVVPTTFSSPSLPSSTVPNSAWEQAYNSSTRTFSFNSGDANNKLGSGQTITASIQVVAPASGTHTWSVTGFANTSGNGGGEKINNDPQVTVGAVKQNQTITFDAITNRVFGDAPVALTATASSGLPVSYSAGPAGVCSIAGGSASLDGAGDCTVTASQAGNSTYNAAPSIARTFTIAKASQTITFDTIDTQTYAVPTATLNLTATGGASNNPVTYTAGPSGVCSISGSVLSLDGAGDCTVTANQAGNANYLAATAVPRTFTIARASAVLSLGGGNVEYDGNPHAATLTTDPAGLSGVTVTYNGSSTVPTDVGTYTLVATLDNPNYAAEQATSELVIEPRDVDGAFDVADHTYDATTDATITDCSLISGVVPSDEGQVSLDCSAATATFDSPNAGSRTASISGHELAGDRSFNYILNPVPDADATISQATISATIQAGDKNYDCTDGATATVTEITGQLDEDVDVEIVSATFANESVGEDKTVTAPLRLTGSSADNYSLDPSTATDEANIWQRQLAGSFSATSRVYDGTRVAETIAHPLADTVCDEDVTLVVSDALFGTKDVGTGKIVTANLSLTGTDAENYVLTSTSGTATADITAKSLIGSVTAEDKVYDGNMTATASPASLTGRVGDEDVSLVVDSASFGSKVVGTDKTVTANLSLSGTDAGNYTVNPTATALADITSKALTASITADDKVYDGSPAASVSPDLEGVVPTDTVSVSATGSFADKNVGIGKTVTASITIGGSDAGNYTVNGTATDTADITALGVLGSITADNKVYDGTTAATVHPIVTGAVVGDDLTISAVGTFADRNVGTGKTVTAALALGGADADNYSVNPTATDTADITPATVVGSFTAADKIWDGTAAATITGRGLTGLFGSDVVDLVGGTATFDNANVGTGKTVTGTGFSITGADAGNYQLASSTLTTTASITPLYSGTGFYKPVDMTPVGGTRIYNTIKGGQTVPLKFEIFNATTLVEQTSLTIFGADAAAQAAAFKATPVSCLSGDSLSDPVEVITTGGTSLRYDSTAGQFIQNWKTPTTTGQCYAVSVKTIDGTAVGPAYFKITK